jgi:hypothetical protein
VFAVFVRVMCDEKKDAQQKSLPQKQMKRFGRRAEEQRSTKGVGQKIDGAGLTVIRENALCLPPSLPAKDNGQKSATGYPTPNSKTTEEKQGALLTHPLPPCSAACVIPCACGLPTDAITYQKMYSYASRPAFRPCTSIRA